jgi:hypothetical protein
MRRTKSTIVIHHTPAGRSWTFVISIATAAPTCCGRTLRAGWSSGLDAGRFVREERVRTPQPSSRLLTVQGYGR